MNRYSLHDKIAVVTGGAGLLGRQHTLAILENGGSAVIIDIDKIRVSKLKKEFLKKRFKIDVFYGDVTNDKQINEIKRKILKKYKKIDILINNAQRDHIPKKKSAKFENLFENYPIKKWDEELDIGLKGAFICSQIFGSEMAKKKNGVILNVASDLSVIAPDQRLYSHLKSFKPVTYSVIKHSLIGLTKYLASYWSSKKIRVNAISPGGVFNNQNKTFVKKVKKLIPMNRMANVEEYKEAIQFLCSDASSYMTGHNLVIDGGRSII
tara:strand:- start:5064 stop:5861 length:798 start_codon:yes stop_codon:yes gene_type:complete